jgi:hypothetical protein
LFNSQPGCGASFTVTGGFLNAATSSSKGVTGRILKISTVTVFKEASNNLSFDFLLYEDKQIVNKPPAHIQKVGTGTDLTL